MPEIRIRYDDDSDRMPYEAIAEVVRAAGQHLPVVELNWVRDDDLDDPDEVTHTVRPDLGGFDKALARMAEQANFRPIWRGAR